MAGSHQLPCSAFCCFLRGLVGKDDDARAECLGIDELQNLRVDAVLDEALAIAECDVCCWDGLSYGVVLFPSVIKGTCRARASHVVPWV